MTSPTVPAVDLDSGADLGRAHDQAVEAFEGADDFVGLYQTTEQVAKTQLV